MFVCRYNNGYRKCMYVCAGTLEGGVMTRIDPGGIGIADA